MKKKNNTNNNLSFFDKEETKDLDLLTSVKLKTSYLFSKSLTSFLKALKDFLEFILIYLIFLTNFYLFYSFSRKDILSLVSCVLFFILSMIFYTLVRKKKNE